MQSKTGRTSFDLRVFDEQGRPIVHESRKPFRDPSGGCCNVLYALALTELLGNRRGLSKRSIRTILQHSGADPRAGTWEWLASFQTQVLTETGEFGSAAIKNAIRKLREEYPIVVLQSDPNLHFPLQSIERSKGGKPADIFVLNSGAILGWPCRAQIMKLITSEIPHVTRLRYSHLARYISEEHQSHAVPHALRKVAKPADTHTLRDDVEFLLRTRYLKLFTHEKGDPRRKEIPHSIPLTFNDNAIIELDERAAWESLYFDRLAKQFANDKTSGGEHHSGYEMRKPQGESSSEPAETYLPIVRGGLNEAEVDVLKLLWKQMYFEEEHALTTKEISTHLKEDETTIEAVLNGLGRIGRKMIKERLGPVSRYELEYSLPSWPPEAVMLCDLRKNWAHTPPKRELYIDRLSRDLIPQRPEIIRENIIGFAEEHGLIEDAPGNVDCIRVTDLFVEWQPYYKWVSEQFDDWCQHTERGRQWRREANEWQKQLENSAARLVTKNKTDILSKMSNRIARKKK